VPYRRKKLTFAISSPDEFLSHNAVNFARIKDDAYVSSSSPGGGTGGEVCRFRLHLVSMAV